MPRSSPPKHRHDGTSPLPLGMDWSPPPRKWEGRNTIWPHDSRTGWSYCVMIPSWMVETGSGASSDSLLNPIIFYRIQIGIQSPEGISSSHDVLRRFSDFLKLFYALKKVYSKKDIPPAPPKRALLRINSSRLLLEERRRALEEWTGKLLADIDLSRSAHIATFLDLEAAARSSFEDTNVVTLKASTSGDALPSIPRRSSSSVSAECLSAASKPHSPASDVSIDTGSNKFGAGEASNGTMGMAAFFDQPEEFPNGNLPRSKGSSSFGGDSSNKNSSKQMLHLRDIGDTTTNQNHEKLSFHSRRLSAESIGSDTSSIRTVDFLPGVTNSFWDGSSDFSGGAVFPTNLEASSNPEKQFTNDVQILISIDQQQKLNRVLFTMERRLVTARTDMEDIITRLNQEMTVKEYLTTKVKDLEAELELTKHRYKENLQQAILLERERFTQTQWDMDELRRKCLELELKFKLEQGEKIRVEPEITSGEKEILLQELSVKQDQIVNLERHLEQLELKSKADIKVLVKEVKLLRNSQEELKKMLSRSTKEKDDIERILQEEREGCAVANCRRKELLRECESLRSQLKECSVNFLSAEKDGFTVNQQSLNDALGLLETSDNRIGLLIAETRLLVEEDEGERADATNADDSNMGDDETRNMLISVLTDNARLRKQLNSVFRCALEALFKAADGKGGGEGETPSQKTIMNRLLWR